jgi:hypothetical protein
MSFVVEDNGGSFESAPTGMHLGRCYRIIDLGTQKSEYMGQMKALRKVMLGWELHAQDDAGNAIRMQDGRPFAMFKNYTLSWSEKANLRLDLQSWRGKPFTEEEQERFVLKSILDKWCMVNVAHKNRKTGSGVYANVTTVLPVLPIYKEMGMPKGHNSCGIFQIDDPDMEMFESFGKAIKAKIELSPEWQSRSKKAAAPKSASGFDDMEDDIPF